MAEALRHKRLSAHAARIALLRHGGRVVLRAAPFCLQGQAAQGRTAVMPEQSEGLGAGAELEAYADRL